MTLSKLLIANRGEIAIRVIRSAADIGIATVAIYSEDDAESLHVHKADAAVALAGRGVRAYLDGPQIVQLAREAGCDSVHPGYGFLAESTEFARACEAAGLRFVGPAVETLELFGDKVGAREVAAAHDVPVLAGSDGATSLAQVRAFFEALPPGEAMMIKAVAGGGGRGMRAVTSADAIEETFELCRSEAEGAFGNGSLYVEQMISRARHIEVQVLGDGTDVIHLGERECSVQRRYQKIVEVAPAPALEEGLRARILAAAMRLAAGVKYRSLGTFEFLVDADDAGDDAPFYFIETNARIQVEHTVTEAVTGVDLVAAQLRVAGGRTLGAMGLTQDRIPAPRGFAIQARVNMETLTADGEIRPASGTLTAFELPSGPGVRTDTYGYVGYTINPAFDSLLAKVIGHSESADFEDAVRRTSRALSEFRIEGVATNLDLLQNLMAHPDFRAGQIDTRFVEEHAAELVQGGAGRHPHRYVEKEKAAQTPSGKEGLVGAQVDKTDPLALFAHNRASKNSEVDSGAAIAAEAPDLTAPDGSVGVPVPIQGTIVRISVAPGDEVRKGQQLAVLEAMKMEHIIVADRSGIVRRIALAEGDVIQEGYPLVFIEEAEVEGGAVEAEEELDLDLIRDDLALLFERRAYTLDENRPEAVARRRKKGQRTARENIERLVDPGSFQEYGRLVVASQRARHSQEYLRRRTPADGLVAGLATINGHLFPDDRARCIIVHYDYTVLAGTQGMRNHKKQDRMYELANRFRIPVVLFGEGGGGRPGDTGSEGGVGIEPTTFTEFSRLSARVPMVGVTSGYCFAGNTALLACCDVIIATEGSTIAMGGPAMIEGGGLGIYTPEECGPMSFQVPNGVVDILVKDENEAVDVVKQYLSYFQGSVTEWSVPDQRRLRHIVPENRVRMYDMREVIETLADEGSVLEIRREFGVGIITVLFRVAGRPMGLIANNPHHLAGAIDSDGSDKGARFLQLCDAFDLPILSIIDCPGIMVGPEVEKTALVRHCVRLFNTGANLSVPMFTLVIRKSYGLGAQAMCGAGSMVPFFTTAWPTAEFAGMNIEGGIKLGYRADLEAIEDPEERLQRFDSMVAAGYEEAKAINKGVYTGIDDVIDPAESRDWIVAGLRSLPPTPVRTEKKRPYIDTW